MLFLNHNQRPYHTHTHTHAHTHMHTQKLLAKLFLYILIFQCFGKLTVNDHSLKSALCYETFATRATNVKKDSYIIL
jgi:hypothetical protein